MNPRMMVDVMIFAESCPALRDGGKEEEQERQRDPLVSCCVGDGWSACAYLDMPAIPASPFHSSKLITLQAASYSARFDVERCDGSAEKKQRECETHLSIINDDVSLRIFLGHPFSRPLGVSSIASCFDA